MPRVLISTIFKKESVALSVKNFGIDAAYLLVDKTLKAEQKQAIEDVKHMYTGVVKIEEKAVELYDIPKVVKAVVDIIDSLPHDEIYIDVTHGRKPQALGVLFAAYLRPNRIKKVVYWTEEEKRMISLPILSFDIGNKERTILEKFDGIKTITELIEKTKLNKITVYRYIRDLESRGFIEKIDGSFKLTDAGKIAVL